MAPQVAAALIAGGVSLVVAAATAAVTFRAQERKLREELRTQFMAEEAINLLLSHPDWQLRSFEQISRHVRGFPADDLRQLLIRAGALAFRGADGTEMWGLRTRNESRLTRRASGGTADSPTDR